jgi:hypothetical protein
MSSTPYAAPLHLEPALPRSILGLTVAVHGVALVSLLCAGLPTAAVLAGSAALLGSLYGVRRKLSPPRRVVWDAEGRWFWRREWGTDELELLPDSLCTPYLVILNFAEAGGHGRRSLLLPRGSLDAALFRRLRVRLARERVGP